VSNCLQREEIIDFECPRFLISPELAIARVRERVRQGGHDVPEGNIRRRYLAGLRNFDRAYRELVDSWSYYDNSGRNPILLDWGEKA